MINAKRCRPIVVSSPVLLVLLIQWSGLLKGTIIDMVENELITGLFKFMKDLPNEPPNTSCLNYEVGFSLNDEAKRAQWQTL